MVDPAWLNSSMRTVISSVLFAGMCLAALQTLHVIERTDYENGKAFGAAGPYERIVAKATYADGEVTTVAVLKPRDPAKGNGTLVVIASPDIPVPPLVDGGYTVLQVPDPNRSNVGDMIAFLRYDGSPFLLGDQRRFLKRTIAVVA